MKRLSLFSLIVAFILSSATVYAEEKSPLGTGNAAVKVGYISFTDDLWDDLQVDDWVYVGLEGYANIMENLYIGTEVGYTSPEGLLEILGNTEMTFIPIELNLKYAIEPVSNVVIDIGAGASCNYVSVEQVFLGTTIIDDNDWLFGGQFFADLSYKIGKLFIGLNGKYQITDDFKDYDADLNNWRIGGQIGMMF